MSDTRRTITAWRLALWVWLDCRARAMARREARRPIAPDRPRETTDGTAALMRLGALGCRPDRSRSPRDADWQGVGEGGMPPDAEAVHGWASAHAHVEAVRWLVRCAERGAPPDWDPGPLAAVPRLRAGRIEVDTACLRLGKRRSGAGSGSGSGLTVVQFCPIDYSGTPEDHADAQGLYADLITGLERLTEAAPTLGLRAHRVMGLGLPPAPWTRRARRVA